MKKAAPAFFGPRRKMSYTQQEKDVFLYLFQLQDSGVTNMFGAAPYLRRKFPLVEQERMEQLLSQWIQEYEVIRCHLLP